MISRSDNYTYISRKMYRTGTTDGLRVYTFAKTCQVNKSNTLNMSREYRLAKVTQAYPGHKQREDTDETKINNGKWFLTTQLRRSV